MTFEEVLDQAIVMLQRRGRLTYRTLKRQLQLDDAALEDPRIELIKGQWLVVENDQPVGGCVFQEVSQWPGDEHAKGQSPGAVPELGELRGQARLTSQQRYEKSTGRDPLMCPHCRGEMGVWRIWHPTYGVIYDEGQVIKRGTYTSTAQRAGT